MTEAASGSSFCSSSMSRLSTRVPVNSLKFLPNVYAHFSLVASLMNSQASSGYLLEAVGVGHGESTRHLRGAQRVAVDPRTAATHVEEGRRVRLVEPHRPARERVVAPDP